MKVSNKTIQYKLKATDESENLVVIDDSAEIQMPSIEKLTDTIKGAGIMGEIDLPVFGMVSAMSLSISNRADNAKYAMLSRPGPIKFEIIWVNDVFDSGAISATTQQNKVFITGFNKKYDVGKVSPGAVMDGSSDFEVIYYRKIVDGKEVLLIDKLNYQFVINGKDYMSAIRTALE